MPLLLLFCLHICPTDVPFETGVLSALGERAWGRAPEVG
jgi:hypothetical protein